MASACPKGMTCDKKGVCQPNPGTGCKTSADCSGSTPFCAEGTCSAACTTDSQCPTGDYCDQGACVVDTRPKPNCVHDSDCTAAGEKCIGGYCEYPCTTNMQCELIDVRLGYCSGTPMVCKDAAEAMPKCTTQADCSPGEDCISNVCQ
jgi:hypothetical protein